MLSVLVRLKECRLQGLSPVFISEGLMYGLKPVPFRRPAAWPQVRLGL
jgi:hypothetical protein